MDFRGVGFSNRPGALSSTGSFPQQVLQGMVPPEFGQKKDVLHILTVIFNSELTFSYCYLFSVWIAATYKQELHHPLHLLISSSDRKSVRSRAGPFLCSALPASGNAQHRTFPCQRLHLGHHVFSWPWVYFLWIHQVLFWTCLCFKSLQCPHMLLGAICYPIILSIVPYVIWSVLWETVKTKQNKIKTQNVPCLLLPCWPYSYRHLSVQLFVSASP